MEKGGGNTKWGCLIVVAIFVIVNLFTMFSSDNKDNIAGFGAMIIGFAVIAGFFWVFKNFSSDQSDTQNTSNNVSIDTHKSDVNLTNGNVIDSKSKSNIKGCIIPLIIVVVALALFGLVLTNFEFNYIVGAIAAIALAVGIGLYFYNIGKD